MWKLISVVSFNRTFYRVLIYIGLLLVISYNIVINTYYFPNLRSVRRQYTSERFKYHAEYERRPSQQIQQAATTYPFGYKQVTTVTNHGMVLGNGTDDGPGVQANVSELRTFTKSNITSFNKGRYEQSIDLRNVSHITTSVSDDKLESTLKQILLWTPYYGSSYFGLKAGNVSFNNPNYNCTVRSCTLTSDKSLIDDADAVVFHAAELPRQLPKHAHDRQVFVFVLYESPARLPPGMFENKVGIFNLTMTYMNNSETDIYTPYGQIVPRYFPATESIPSPNRIQLKSELVAWVVSNFHPWSSRKEYAAELQKHVTVDVYGMCGKNDCPKGNMSCFKEIIRDHMFMLAFENSYCDDYVTEKLFRALSVDVVPITLGRANYSKILPPKSYIDVRDFQSPEHLAQHLLYLSNNHTAYSEYFEWKRLNTVMNHGYTRPRSFCRLCEILHDGQYKFKTNFDPAFYWDESRNCLERNKERKEVHLIA